MEKVHAMLITSQLPDFLWGEALNHAIWLKNRTWTRALPTGKTPYELLYDSPALLNDIPTWGAHVWVYETSSGKLGVRVCEGRWVGVDTSSNGHRIYWPEKRSVSVERNVTFSHMHLPVDDEPILLDSLDSAAARGRDVDEAERKDVDEDEDDETEVADALTQVSHTPPQPEVPSNLPDPPILR
jgi:hypothetical protein